ncbi:MAG TPA: class I SAM-dependent methyltransferase, partial [Polyangia bacterium]
MALPRLHLFEFNDSTWAPRALRDTIVESLSRTLAWGHLLRGLIAPFEEFIARAGVDEVLDVCAGAAGP